MEAITNNWEVTDAGHTPEDGYVGKIQILSAIGVKLNAIAKEYY